MSGMEQEHTPKPASLCDGNAPGDSLQRDIDPQFFVDQYSRRKRDLPAYIPVDTYTSIPSKRVCLDLGGRACALSS